MMFIKYKNIILRKKNEKDKYLCYLYRLIIILITMGADGGIYFYEDSKENPFFTQLLNSLIDWICSDNCHIEFTGSLFVKNNTIYIYDDGQTEDDGLPFFTKELLTFLNLIHTHISDFCSSNMSIPSDKSEYIMTWAEFDWNQKNNSNFDFRDDFDELLQTTKEINEAWDKSGSLWFYWDTNSFHTGDPFYSKIDFNELYDNCTKCPTSFETFKKIFSDKKMFCEFTSNYLPTPDYVQAWT